VTHNDWRQGYGLGTTIKYLRSAADIGLGTTIKYPRGAADIGLGKRLSTRGAQRAVPRATTWALQGVFISSKSNFD
jgi:hypothetical protein